MDFKNITSQDEMDKFISCVYWEHAFFREIYILSPSFIYPDGASQAYPDFCPNIGMIILCFDSEIPAVEIKFIDVEDIRISFTTNFQPTAVMFRDKAELKFNPGSIVRAKIISYRFLNKDDIMGDKLKYGKYWNELFS
jgi:hypothetical protein